MSLTDKFEICTKYDRATRFQATLDSTTSKYTLRNTSRLEDAYDAPLTYTAKFVQEAIDCGNWIVVVTKDMSPATEPELVFPITAKHRDDSVEYPNRHLVITKSAEWGLVDVIWYENDVYGTKKTDIAFWTVEDCKRLIKEGKWIVKAVGEEAPQPTVTISYAPVADGEKFYLKCSSVGDESISVAAPQAPQSTPLSSLSLSIKCDTEAAVGAVERLTQALEDLAISYESVIALQKKFKEGV